MLPLFTEYLLVELFFPTRIDKCLAAHFDRSYVAAVVYLLICYQFRDLVSGTVVTITCIIIFVSPRLGAGPLLRTDCVPIRRNNTLVGFVVFFRGSYDW